MKALFALFCLLFPFGSFADGISLTRDQYLSKWHAGMLKAVCGNPEESLRRCFGFSEKECSEPYGRGLDECGKKFSNELPTTITKQEFQAVSAIAEKIDQCAKEKFAHQNAAKILKDKCPDLAPSSK